MSVTVKTFVDLDVKGISKSFQKALDNTNKSSAKLGKNMASTLFAQKYQALEPHKHDEHVFTSFTAKQSLYGKKGGWIFGPMASGSGDWEDTVGGRSFFFEYGRMPPGKGRGTVGRKAYKKAGGNIDSEGQESRPYMRPTKEALIPIHNKSMTKACNRLTKTLNRKYTTNSSTKIINTRRYTPL